MTRLAVLVATAGGAGYFPKAPGTAGSAVGAVIYLLTSGWGAAWQVSLVLVISAIGVWASGRAAVHFGNDDPGLVVVDEVAGQLLTLCLTGAGPWGTLFGFLIFRAFDIAKPWPVRQCEQFPGGIGIMADDLMAGLYGNIIVSGTFLLLPGLRAW